MNSPNINQLCWALAITLIAGPPIIHTVSGQQIDEQQLGSSLEKEIELGQALWLDKGGRLFFSIFMPDQSGQPKGAVIIIHDANAHPNWPDVVRPLRTFLPLHGWATLAIQSPQLNGIGDYNSTQEIVNGRIDKSIEHLQSLGLNNIALIGHGTGAMTGVSYLANKENHSIKGFVGISLGVIKQQEPGETYIPAQLEKLKLPILDIYGSKDLPMVTQSADIRALSAKQSGEKSKVQGNIEAYKRSAMATAPRSKVQGYIAFRQIKIEGANHLYTAHQHTLTKRILGWLDRHTKGVAINLD